MVFGIDEMAVTELAAGENLGFADGGLDEFRELGGVDSVGELATDAGDGFSSLLAGQVAKECREPTSIGRGVSDFGFRGPEGTVFGAMGGIEDGAALLAKQFHMQSGDLGRFPAFQIGHGFAENLLATIAGATEVNLVDLTDEAVVVDEPEAVRGGFDEVAVTFLPFLEFVVGTFAIFRTYASDPCGSLDAGDSSDPDQGEAQIVGPLFRLAGLECGLVQRNIDADGSPDLAGGELVIVVATEAGLFGSERG